ncbi:hypothetical protein ZHAS_00010913 [Anopheles sinensis]|uniref:Uncharacterized protein n=1 Tax=Anopheles sinensis TaxID=74873 RepID=A0A084VYU8_ANOSI|nr:hypothetical protein ZHAS_00010913 [Anopheles sinensis]
MSKDGKMHSIRVGQNPSPDVLKLWDKSTHSTDDLKLHPGHAERILHPFVSVGPR